LPSEPEGGRSSTCLRFRRPPPHFSPTCSTTKQIQRAHFKCDGAERQSPPHVTNRIDWSFGFTLPVTTDQPKGYDDWADGTLPAALLQDVSGHLFYAQGPRELHLDRAFLLAVLTRCKLPAWVERRDKLSSFACSSHSLQAAI
jgi:hypothetical protein